MSPDKQILCKKEKFITFHMKYQDWSWLHIFWRALNYVWHELYLAEL